MRDDPKPTESEIVPVDPAYNKGFNFGAALTNLTKNLEEWGKGLEAATREQTNLKQITIERLLLNFHDLEGRTLILKFHDPESGKSVDLLNEFVGHLKGKRVRVTIEEVPDEPTQ